LGRCLDSLIIPDIDKIEIIVVNHASTDHTHEVAMAYKNRFPQSIKVVDVKENGHYGRAINNALANATGKFFKLLDADDTYCKENLAEFVSFLEESDSDIIFSPYIVLDFDSNYVSSFVCPEEMLGHPFSLNEVNWRDPNLEKFRAMHSMATKTDILQSNNYFQTEGIAYSDTQLVFFSDLYSQTCSFFNKPIYNYYLGRDGQTMSAASIKKNCLHFYKNAQRMLDIFESYSEKQSISDNKLKLLADSVYIQVYYFFGVVIGGERNNIEYIPYINELIGKCSSAAWRNTIAERLNSNKFYVLFKKYHFPNRLIFLLRHFK
jgi:glycosyltransferase involved in cell wall biosynthesis